MTVMAYNTSLRASLEVVGSYGWNGEDRMIYADALPAYAKVLKARLADDHQNVVVITGGTGSGKSTLAIQICRELAKQLGHKWSLSDNYIYSTADLKRKLEDPKSSPINLFDEGSVSLNSNNAQKSEDKMMVVLFDTMRSLGWTSVICIPHIDSLNKRIRSYHMDYLLMCPDHPLMPGYDRRGFAQIFKHELRQFGKPYERLIATTIYDDLPPRIRAEYARIKKEHQMALIEQFIREDD